MKIAYLHGLESRGHGPKNDLLRVLFSEVYDPDINYREDGIYDKIFNELVDFKPDYIVGSSLGGWFAFNIGKKLGIPTLLFNPALQGRTTKVDVDSSGTYRNKNIVVLGGNDDVINPLDTLINLVNWECNVEVYKGNHGHRVPFETFEEYLLSLT